MNLCGAAFLLTALLIVLYYAATVPVERSFGERYVTSQIPLLFPFYVISSFKPVTLIVYLTFAGAILVLEANKEKLMSIDIGALKISLYFLAFASGYEVIWNFLAWFSSWETSEIPLDLIANQTHEYSWLPVNFNFATKISFLIFALSLYGIRFVDELDRQKSATIQGVHRVE